jgi:hypothetical protein
MRNAWWWRRYEWGDAGWMHSLPHNMRISLSSSSSSEFLQSDSTQRWCHPKNDETMICVVFRSVRLSEGINILVTLEYGSRVNAFKRSFVSDRAWGIQDYCKKETPRVILQIVINGGNKSIFISMSSISHKNHSQVVTLEDIITVWFVPVTCKGDPSDFGPGPFFNVPPPEKHKNTAREARGICPLLSQ